MDSPAPPVSAPPGPGPGAQVLRWLPRALGVVLVAGTILFVALPARLFPVTTASLPGLLVDLPLVSGRRQVEGGYRNGEVMVKAPLDRVVVQVSWEPGGVFDDADMDQMAKMVGAGLGASGARSLELPAPVGLAASSRRMEIPGKTPLLLSVIGCGGRRVSLMTAGYAPGLEGLHRRMLASVRCQPEPDRERSLTDIPVVMDVPESWRLAEATAEHLLATDGSFAILVRTMRTQIPTAVYERMLPALVEGLHVGAREGDTWPVEGSAGGETVVGWVAIRECPEQQAAMMIITTHPNDANGARGWLDKVRCRRKDEPPQSWVRQRHAPQPHLR